MKPDLDGLKDNELQDIITRANQLLEQRKEERRQEAIEKARATLAEAGLTVDDLRVRKKRNKAAYQSGVRYQHPEKPEQVWAGKGKKPHWLRDLEEKGIKPLEIK